MRGLRVLEAQRGAGPGFAREWILNMARSAQARGLGREMHVNILTTLWQRKWLFTLIAGVIVFLIVGVGLLLEERYGGPGRESGASTFGYKEHL